MKRFLVFTILVFLLAVLFWQAFYLPKDFASKKEILFKVSREEGSKEIALNLEKQGLIKDKFLFQVFVFLKQASRKLQAGSYLLSPSMSMPQIFEKIISGDGVKEKITIFEGWNLKDVARFLENKGMFQAEEVLEFSQDFSQEGLEGYLFPDTYFVDKDATLTEIIQLILDNFDKKLSPDLREEIKGQGKSIFEIITMASLLEKEVKTFEDKQVVSGILWKRLEIAMPLQVDATITYITGRKTTEISKEETEIDSPYNTYKYRGLPKGPICNPGLDSIRAAVYPEESDYWYYLSALDGESIFSKTLDEHNIAKAKYL